jgi:hypothetical protein
VRARFSYAEALALLGGGSPAVTALDRTLNGALLLATAGGSQLMAGLFAARGEAVRVGHELVRSVRSRPPAGRGGEAEGARSRGEGHGSADRRCERTPPDPHRQPPTPPPSASGRRT